MQTSQDTEKVHRHRKPLLGLSGRSGYLVGRNEAVNQGNQINQRNDV